MYIYRIYRLCLICLFIVSATIAGIARAESVYVSDELEITLRSGPGVQNKITKMLKSGEMLEISSRNGDGYAQVTTAEGASGWVLTRFLMDDPSARSRLDELTQREASLNTQQREIAKLRLNASSREKMLSGMRTSNTSLKAELTKVKQVAADTLLINDKNNELTASLKTAVSKQNVLQLENERLKNNSEQAWFLRGAGVILAGMVLGLLIPKLRFKKKRKWGDFSSYGR